MNLIVAADKHWAILEQASFWFHMEYLENVSESWKSTGYGKKYLKAFRAGSPYTDALPLY